MRRLYPLAGRAHLVGITGPPGAGKTTLVAALIGEVRRGRPVGGRRRGRPVVADHRRRAARRSGPDAGLRRRRGVFIRSMASRGHAGGLAATSAAAAAVLDAAGFDLVLIETVGTGQSEVEVAAAADTTVVLEAPEMGDEVQAIKAGLLEVADLVVVNKGDRPGRPADGRPAAGDARSPAATAPRARRGRRDRPRPKRPEVLITTATTGDGVPELLAALDRHRAAGRAARTPDGPARPRRGPGLGDPRRPAARRLLAAPSRAADTDAILDEVADHAWTRTPPRTACSPVAVARARSTGLTTRRAYPDRP